LQVLGQASEESISGYQVDMILAKIMAEKFDAKTKKTKQSV